MTRDDLIRNLVDRQSNLSYKMAGLAVKHIITQMSNNLSNGARIEIRGFGSFVTRNRQPRLARNPKTGVQLQKSNTYVVHFKPGKELKARVNNAAKVCSEEIA